MEKAEWGKRLIIIGIIIVILGACLNIVSWEFEYIFGMLGYFVGYGGGGLAFLGFIIYMIGDKYITCGSCGAKIKDNLYICQCCNTKNPKYFHQKVPCQRCYKKTRFDEYGGRCKYCGSPLYLP